MISAEKAQCKGVDFLNSEKLPELSKMVTEGACLWKIFPQAVRSLGRKQVLILYHKLPPDLKEYFLVYFLTDSEKFNDRLRRNDAKHGIAGSQEYLRTTERLLVRYLEE